VEQVRVEQWSKEAEKQRSRGVMDQRRRAEESGEWRVEQWRVAVVFSAFLLAEMI
jgi:hypothetical protein